MRGKKEPPVLSITGYFTRSVVRLGKVINRDVRDNVGQTRVSRVARGGNTFPSRSGGKRRKCCRFKYRNRMGTDSKENEDS